MRTHADNPWPVALTVAGFLSLFLLNGCSGDRREPRAQGTARPTFTPHRLIIPDEPTLQVHDFATVDGAYVVQSLGKPARYRITLDSRDEEIRSYTVVECKSGDNKSRTAWLPAGQWLDGDRFIVEGTIRIVPHFEKDGFPGFMEFRLFGVVVEE